MKLTVYLLAITHEHGTTLSAHATKAERTQALVEYCVEYKNDLSSEGREQFDAFLAEGDWYAAIEVYFDELGTESYETATDRVELKLPEPDDNVAVEAYP